MLTRVSVKGQTVIPGPIREMARIKTGDQLDVGFSAGLIVMRKRRPLTASHVRALLLAGRDLSELTAKDEENVAKAIERVRRRAKV
jgi:AbrB family looped-hinge helix DNA binding protein